MQNLLIGLQFYFEYDSFYLSIWFREQCEILVEPDDIEIFSVFPTFALQKLAIWGFIWILFEGGHENMAYFTRFNYFCWLWRLPKLYWFASLQKYGIFSVFPIFAAQKLSIWGFIQIFDGVFWSYSCWIHGNNKIHNCIIAIFICNL